ncbi:hypothetical protein BBJ29_008355 [Phytophthora kernoviae]|uniref:Uncharacterized protein n=1 Tax=Phytophthora kernoviae TaxID=325452 RepID=A0A3F2RDH8_9STRA|nr:hypothetical protein BBP00_00009123 [Phytophthora kernoviae]RLN71801.1 hypothetical protein BBJ29_008355 [Phytophthora kernoviae]
MRGKKRLPLDKDQIVPEMPPSDAEMLDEFVSETPPSDTKMMDGFVSETMSRLEPPSQTVDELSQGLLQFVITPSTPTRPPAPKTKKTRAKKVTPKSKQIQTRTGKPQRQKTSGTIMEKAFKKRKGYCSIACRLEMICSNSILREEIRHTAHAMKQIQLEAWLLVNLHALRCLENGLPLPDYSAKTFFDRCCSGVATTSHTHFIAQKILTSGNPSSQLKYELREQMVVNAGVMIREHFCKRLRLYVQITFGYDSTVTKKEKSDLVKTIMHACYSVDETDVLEALQIRDALTPDGVESVLTVSEFAQLSIEEKYEHTRHLFANQVTTNGYGASVLLFRPKSKEEKSDKKSAEGPVVPPGYVPNAVIGLDRGMRAVSRFEKYLERLEYFWRHVKFLMQFYADRPFLKWKFFQKRMARVAVDEIARRIVPTVSRQTYVAYGDWSRRKGIKGHAPSPVKGLKEALRKRATVVSMDEFKTRKPCSQCHQTLSKVRYSMDTKLSKRKKCNGVMLARNRAEVEFEEKKCHAVMRCDHDDCGARCWDRDVNAAINMLELLKSEVLGCGRMEPFRRS